MTKGLDSFNNFIKRSSINATVCPCLSGTKMSRALNLEALSQLSVSWFETLYVHTSSDSQSLKTASCYIVHMCTYIQTRKVTLVLDTNLSSAPRCCPLVLGPDWLIQVTWPEYWAQIGCHLMCPASCSGWISFAHSWQTPVSSHPLLGIKTS